MKQEFTSKGTSIRQKTASKGFTVYQSKIGFIPGAMILDYGGGRYDDSVEYMKKYGCKVLVYDPYNRTDRHNTAVLSSMRVRKPDYIVCSNVLNVIKENDIIDAVVKRIYHIAVKGTICIFSMYEGNGTGVGKITGPDQYQRNERTAAYLRFIKKYFGESRCFIKYGLILAYKM